MQKILKSVRGYFYPEDIRTRKARVNSFHMLVNKGLSLLCSLLFLPLFLTAFDSVQYGLWATILSVINWIGFFDVGLGQGLRNKLAEAVANGDYKLANEYINTTYFAVSIIFGLFILIFVIIYPFVDWFKIINAPVFMAAEINIVIFISVLMTLLTFIARQVVFIFYGLQEPRMVSNMGLWSQLLCLATVFIAINIFHLSSLVYYSIIMTTIPLAIYIIHTIWLFVRKDKRLKLGIRYIRVKYISQLLGLGFRFFLIQVCNIILFNSNNFIIAKVLGPDRVSQFYVTYQYMSILTSLFFIITTPYWSAVTDAYTKKDYKWIERSVKELNRWFCVISIIGLCMVFVSKIAFSIWVGDSIKVSFLLVLLMYIYVIIQCFGNIYISIINGTGKIKLQFWIVFFSALIYFPLAIYMTKLGELMGLLITMITIAIITNLWAPLQYIIMRKDFYGTEKGV